MEFNMYNLISKHRTLSLTLVFAGSIAAANLAVAQQITEEIIISMPAERVIDVTPVGSPIKIETTQINRSVNIADLDLAKSADVKELDMRIEAVAKESCENLSDMFPFDRSNPMEMSSCISRAVKSAGKQRESATTIGH
jgi:UrcA family protein